MDAEGARSKLRSAVYRGDGRAVVALAPRTTGPDDPLQLLGDGLAAALAQTSRAQLASRWPAPGACGSEASKATATSQTISRPWRAASAAAAHRLTGRSRPAGHPSRGGSG